MEFGVLGLLLVAELVVFVNDHFDEFALVGIPDHLAQFFEKVERGVGLVR